MISEKAPERKSLEYTIAQIIDHPSVFMGGPSHNSLRLGGMIMDVVWPLIQERADVADAMVAAAYEDAAQQCYADQGRFDSPDRIRSLTPEDARAVLDERDRQTWNAAIDAALGVRLTYLVDSEANPTGKIVRRPDEDIAAAIAALKKETQG